MKIDTIQGKFIIKLLENTKMREDFKHYIKNEITQELKVNFILNREENGKLALKY